MSIFDAPSLPQAVTAILGFGASLGWQQERGLNPNLFVTLQDKVSGVSVRGRIISYSVSNQAEWANKFEGSDADSKLPISTAILQSGAFAKELEFLQDLEGRTMITKAQSIQVWTGLQPQNISLEIEFRAFNDPVSEVEAPIQELVKMMSPVLKDTTYDSAKKWLEGSKKEGTSKEQSNPKLDAEGDFTGIVPSKIAVSLFGKRFNATYRIESMDESVDEMKIDGAGNRIYQVVSLTLGSSVGITKSDIKSPSAFRI